MIKRSQYQYKGKTGFDVLHFETDDKSVRVMNGQTDFGTLQELKFTGKTVTTGKVTDLKISGLYKIKGLTGMPNGLPADKIHILSIKAIGNLGSPEMIQYQLVTEDGSIYNQTCSGGVTTQWTAAGSKMESKINSLLKDYNSFKTEMQGHNHDSRYIRKENGVVVEDINLGVGKKITIGGKDLAKVNDSGVMEIGDANSEVHILAKGEVLLNGKKVVVADKNGVGVNAQYLDGIPANSYALRTGGNTFNGACDFDQGILLNKVNDRTSDGIFWNDPNGKMRYSTGLRYTGSDYVFVKDQVWLMSINNKGRVRANDLEVSGEATANRAVIDMKIGSNDKGMQIMKDKAGRYFGLNNMNVPNGWVFWVDDDNTNVHFDKEIYISGKKLFIQSGTPTGDIPEGSIWINS